MSTTESSPTRLVVKAEGSGASSLRVRPFRLVVIDGPDKGHSCEAADDRVTVGKVPGADLVLSDQTVSRYHLQITATPLGFLLEDLGSTNGTFLEGYRVKEVYLRHGARLGVGHSLVELRVGGVERDIALSAQQRFGPLVGADTSMRRVFAILQRIAPTDATVLVQGETGTGKELVARALHQHSERKDKPFVVVDAGSLPPTLIESELFGHEKGSFTGAATARAGAFEEAEGGTVFLDELGELPLELQPKLLRVLEQREVRRVGSNRPRPVNVRVIAATNRELRSEVNRGSFRADLYYRLAVVTVSLPPLRDRPGDIELLARTFLEELGRRAGRTLSLSDRALARLQASQWPGNVRELRNFIERSVWLSEGDLLQVTGLLESGSVEPPSVSRRVEEVEAGRGPRVSKELPYKIAKQQWTEYFDEVYLPPLLERCSGNVSKAAREAQLDRAYLIRLLRRHGLKD
jgi:transcriptional regulator with GAF, ATPase, and Fis domain